MAQSPSNENSSAPSPQPQTWAKLIGLLPLVLAAAVLVVVVSVMLRPAPAPATPAPANPMPKPAATRPAAAPGAQTRPATAATQPSRKPGEANARTAAPVATTAPAPAPAAATPQEAEAPKRPPTRPTGFIVPAGRSPIPQEGEEDLIKPITVERSSPSSNSGSDRPRRRPAAATAPAAAAAPTTAPASKASDFLQTPGAITWNEAPKFVNKSVTVEGAIIATHNTGTVCFLNFDRNWRESFYIVLVNNAYKHDWSNAPEQHFLNKQIVVTGEVRLHRNRPQIEVSDPGQIRIIGPAKVESFAIPSDDDDATP